MKRKREHSESQNKRKKTIISGNYLFDSQIVITTPDGYSEAIFLDDEESWFQAPLISQKKKKVKKFKVVEKIVYDAPMEKADELLVRKYVPTRYQDLLTSHWINRQAKKWLDEWHEVVFEGKDNFPIHKVLLLSGPPGVGKTALVHVIGKLCGYDCLEINASDERKKKSFVAEIRKRTENQSWFQARKPALVILDEIDGATSGRSGAISGLIQIIKDTKTPLKRPIVCICNDIYSPAVRELKQHCYQIQVFKDDDVYKRVEKKLNTICEVEKIPIPEMTFIRDIVKRFDGDIRLCLNTLEFIRFKSGKSNFHYKDVQKSFFVVLKEYFQPPLKVPISSKYQMIGSEYNNKSFSDAIFHNLYQIRPFFPSEFGSVIEINKWFEFIVQVESCNLPHFVLYALIAIQGIMNIQQSKPKLFLDTDFYKIRKSLHQNQNVVQSVKETFPAPMSIYYRNTNSIVMDFLPYFSQIVHGLSSSLRGQISDLYLFNDQEIRIFNELASRFYSYGFSFQNSLGKAPHHMKPKNDIQLQPNIFEILKYDGGDKINPPLGFQVKSFISRLTKATNKDRTLLLKSIGKSQAAKDELAISNQPQVSGMLKFVYEDAASTAVRQPAKMDEFS